MWYLNLPTLLTGPVVIGPFDSPQQVEELNDPLQDLARELDRETLRRMMRTASKAA